MAVISSAGCQRRGLLHGFVAVVAGGCVPRGPLVTPAADGTVALGPGPSFAELTSGRVTVIDFWATWCEPCRASIPKVIAFAREQRANGVVVVGVHVGPGYDEALRFAGEAGIDYPIFADPEYRLSTALGATRVPTIIVRDRQAVVVASDDEINPSIVAAVAAALRR